MSNTNICERVEDLIGFLYGELSEVEARRFERHLRECATCEAEFTAFGQIHESMVEWRNESLGLSGVPVASVPAALAPATAQPGLPPKSALAALREFFVLSPWWMRAATGFAAVLFCVCAVLATGYLKGRQSRVVNSDRVYSEEQLQARLAAERQRLQPHTPATDVAANQPAPLPVSHRNVSKTPEVSPKLAVAGNFRNARRPFTKQERQELATDLRLVSARDDDDLDLSTDAGRPTP